MNSVGWRLNPQTDLHWRQIDGDWLVYEHLTGATHLLDPLSAGVLMCFEPGAPLSLAQLQAELAGLGFDAVSDEEAARAVRQFCALETLLPATGPTLLHAAP